jgi:hypothetical protein
MEGVKTLSEVSRMSEEGVAKQLGAHSWELSQAQPPQPVPAYFGAQTPQMTWSFTNSMSAQAREIRDGMAIQGADCWLSTRRGSVPLLPVPTTASDLTAPLQSHLHTLAPFLLPHQIPVVAQMLVKEAVCTTRHAFFVGAELKTVVSAVTLDAWQLPATPYNSTGGVLWAPVGAGKTVMTFALSLLHRTLVVVPARLVKQWEEEARKFGIRVALAYGPHKSEPAADAQVVLTSFETFVGRQSDYGCERLVMDEAIEKGENTAAVQLLERTPIVRRWCLTASVLGRSNAYSKCTVYDRLLRTYPEMFTHVLDREPSDGSKYVSVSGGMGRILDANWYMNTTPHTYGNYFSPCDDHRRLSSVGGLDPFLRAVTPRFIFSISSVDTRRYIGDGRVSYRRTLTYIPLGRVCHTLVRGSSTPAQYSVSHVDHVVSVNARAVIEVREWWGWSRQLRALGILRAGLNFQFTAEELRDRLSPFHPSAVSQGVDVTVESCASPEEFVNAIMKATTSGVVRAFVEQQVALVHAASDDDMLTCPICLESIEWPVVVLGQCGHAFCRECGQAFLRARRMCWCRHRLTDKPALFHLAPGVPSSPLPPVVEAATRLSSNGTPPPTAKLVAAMDCVADIVRAQRVQVVFCELGMTAQFMKADIQARFPGAKLRVLSGAQSITQKHRIIDEFQRGEVAALFLTYALGGVGLNFQNASDVVIADVPVYQNEYDQAVGRVARHGQTHPEVRVHVFRSDNYTEMHLLPVANGSTLGWHEVFS